MAQQPQSCHGAMEESRVRIDKVELLMNPTLDYNKGNGTRAKSHVMPLVVVVDGRLSGHV